jgi:hypothetical protein
MRIVILDESPLVRDLLHDTLQAQGLHPVRAPDARTALAAGGELVLADASWRRRAPELANLRVLDKGRSLDDALAEALGAAPPRRWVSTELRARFRARFHAVARQRLGRAVDLFEAAGEDAVPELARELDHLASEAQLVDLPVLADVARAAGLHALAWASSGAFLELVACAGCLSSLCRSLSEELTGVSC